MVDEGGRPLVGVFERVVVVVGVAARRTGVFALDTGGGWCLEVFTDVGGRFVDGELDRVEASLLGFDMVLSFLTETGRREVGEMACESDLCSTANC